MTPTHQTTTHPKRVRGKFRINRWVVLTILTLLLVAGLRTFVYDNYYVPSPSMAPTIGVGDHITVLRQPLAVPTRGDIVVFSDTQNWSGQKNVHIVKRIIGVPGDTIECCNSNNDILLNGVPLREPYTHHSDNRVSFPAVKVPEGHVWVMGDNREHSADSSAHVEEDTAFVPIKDIVGVVVLRMGSDGFTLM